MNILLTLSVILTIFLVYVVRMGETNPPFLSPEEESICLRAHPNDSACQVMTQCKSDIASCPLIQNEGGVMMCAFAKSLLESNDVAANVQQHRFYLMHCYFACHDNLGDSKENGRITSYVPQEVSNLLREC